MNDQPKMTKLELVDLEQLLLKLPSLFSNDMPGYYYEICDLVSSLVEKNIK